MIGMARHCHANNSFHKKKWIDSRFIIQTFLHIWVNTSVEPVGRRGPAGCGSLRCKSCTRKESAVDFPPRLRWRPDLRLQSTRIVRLIRGSNSCPRWRCCCGCGCCCGYLGGNEANVPPRAMLASKPLFQQFQMSVNQYLGLDRCMSILIESVIDGIESLDFIT